MGLSLAFRPGEDFYVGDERFTVVEVISPISFTVRRDRDGHDFPLANDGRRVEIAPNVLVRVGTRGQGNLARIAFTAPQSVVILTGRNYRAGRENLG
ncbi:hypothetical protein [Acidocella sp. KAb 2-4]|uniref:hypothetical protein n=1 Tax=Acidocella sp. KAb 2-4 TaxID=2885158 RepID=UPI001D07A7A6|nr:hypothetical protein [Acidocella sp. KAb 2-4]MCB5945901.1 hypothetical protein [Acidocella sp. KAb 2-4]